MSSGLGHSDGCSGRVGSRGAGDVRLTATYGNTVITGKGYALHLVVDDGKGVGGDGEM